MVTSGVLVYVKVGKNLEVDEPLRQTRTCAFLVRLRRASNSNHVPVREGGLDSGLPMTGVWVWGNRRHDDGIELVVVFWWQRHKMMIAGSIEDHEAANDTPRSKILNTTFLLIRVRRSQFQIHGKRQIKCC